MKFLQNHNSVFKSRARRGWTPQTCGAGMDVRLCKGRGERTKTGTKAMRNQGLGVEILDGLAKASFRKWLLSENFG